MKKMIKGTVFVCCLALAACGSDNNDANNGASNNGASNNGASNNGASNNGASNNGASNNGATTGGGSLTTGADCQSGDVCTDGLCTPKTDDPCDGVCEAYLATGDACAAGEGFCNFATDACDFATAMVCVTKAAKDAECFTGQCEANLYCEKAAAGDVLGTCSDLIAVDVACPAFFGCEADLYCDASDPTAPVCTAKTLELDEDCSAAPQACKAPNFCDAADTNTCIAFEATTCE